ncbi:hypothetical protein SO802_003566 [Lithocarpus litseifolius]|uniref:RNase H type-1 domain-containing protein n=1 Tax=Lithocarpus litseifolius TaxID=425828 RepID=A0AAW2E116_9ROSI
MTKCNGWNNGHRDYVLEYLDPNAQQSQVVPRCTQTHWSLPFEQNYKGNFDVAFFDDSGCAVIGVVFRDHMGQIIATLSQRIPLVQSVELAEAMAARHALLFAKELSLFNVEIEGDCSRVITALNQLGRSYTLFGHITNECNRLGATLRFCKFRHVRREGIG